MKFIIKIFKMIFVLFISLLIFACIFSVKNNMSFGDTISHLKTFGSNLLKIDNSDSTLANSDNTIILTSSNNQYYYEQLDETGKTIYAKLENNIDKLKQDNYVMNFSTTFNDLLNTSTGKYRLNKAFQSALDAFFSDHPELFYLDLSNFSLNMQCVTIGPLKTYTVEIAPSNNNYLNDGFKSKQDVELAINKIEKIKKDVINKVSDYNTYNKIKYVHDMLVNSIEYDKTYSKTNRYNIYGALVEKQVVCEGYAKAFKYILDGLDIECILVSGTASNSSGDTEAHMWNYVKLNDNWYGVDVTWDDPIIIGGSNKNNLRDTYLLKGSRTFRESHLPSGKISETGMLFNLPSLSNKNYK